MPLAKAGTAVVDQVVSTIAEPASGMGLTAARTNAGPKAVVMNKDNYWERKEARDLAKDPIISRAGIWQAAVQCQAIVQYAPDLETYKKLVRELAEDGLRFVNESK